MKKRHKTSLTLTQEARAMLRVIADDWYGLSQSTVVELLIRSTYAEGTPETPCLDTPEKESPHENPDTAS